MITITKGQWFPLTISNIQYGGADFDISKAQDVAVALVGVNGTRVNLTYTISAYNELSAVQEGTVNVGKYAIEVSCKDADGKSYRMMSPDAVLSITAGTSPSEAQKIKVTGDGWELTADVKMHEGQARTYMSLLEEARQKAVKAADDAEAVIGSVQASATQAEAAADTAKKASASAETAVASATKAVTDANNAIQSIERLSDAESKRVSAEQGRVSAEQGRVSAEQGRVSAEQGRVTAEQGRVSAEQGRVSAEQGRVTAEQGREKEMSDYMLVIKKPIVSTSESSVAMDANKFYAITVGSALTLDINAAQDEAITNDWEGCFDTGATAPTVTWPANVNWGTSYMTIDTNTHYEFSIRQSGGKYYGILFGWALS